MKKVIVMFLMIGVIFLMGCEVHDSDETYLRPMSKETIKCTFESEDVVYSLSIPDSNKCLSGDWDADGDDDIVIFDYSKDQITFCENRIPRKN